MIKTMISHAKEDDSFVDYLYEKLDRENLGLDIFVDHKQNLAGFYKNCFATSTYSL